MEKVLKILGILLPLLMLSAGSWTDLREKKVDIRPILLAAGAGIAFRAVMRDESVPALLAALAPGMIFIALAVASRGGVGMGDGLCVLVLGLYFSPEEILMILFAALCFGGVIGAVFLFRGRGRGHAFPFLPCLLGGCLCCEIARILLQR